MDLYRRAFTGGSFGGRAGRRSCPGSQARSSRQPEMERTGISTLCRGQKKGDEGLGSRPRNALFIIFNLRHERRFPPHSSRSQQVKRKK